MSFLQAVAILYDWRHPLLSAFENTYTFSSADVNNKTCILDKWWNFFRLT